MKRLSIVLMTVLALALSVSAGSMEKIAKGAAERTDSMLAAREMSDAFRDSVLGATITVGVGSSTGLIGWLADSTVFRPVPPHDTSIEKITAIIDRCDTTIETATASEPDRDYALGRKNGGAYKPLTYWVSIVCVTDTVWGLRDDLKLTPEDIAKLVKFLRGQWSPPQNLWGQRYQNIGVAW